MYLLFRRGVVNGGQWGPVNDEQAAIVSENLGRVAVAIAQRMYPDAEIDLTEVDDAFTFTTTVCNRKPEKESEEGEALKSALHAIIDAVSDRMRDPALWRKDFDPDTYLEAEPL